MYAQRPDLFSSIKHKENDWRRDTWEGVMFLVNYMGCCRDTDRVGYRNVETVPSIPVALGMKRVVQ